MKRYIKDEIIKIYNQKQTIQYMKLYEKNNWYTATLQFTSVCFTSITADDRGCVLIPKN